MRLRSFKLNYSDSRVGNLFRINTFPTQTKIEVYDSKVSLLSCTPYKQYDSFDTISYVTTSFLYARVVGSSGSVTFHVKRFIDCVSSCIIVRLVTILSSLPLRARRPTLLVL